MTDLPTGDQETGAAPRVMRPGVEALVRVWRTVLRDDSLDEVTDFFDAGGTSLTAVRLRSHIRVELRRDLDLLTIIDNPTPLGLSPHLHDAPVWEA
ncbi:acyl carrier protein [Virgisporangium aurantiacum]|nr:acyl carrier protein [Virgisporangium aurantiacum]